MPVRADNIFIFAGLAQSPGQEQLSTLFKSRSVKIERIVSRSYGSPTGFWYDQCEDEWVMVLRGHATLEFEGGEIAELREGDYVTIPRHAKHRVHQTGSETIWLTVHIK
jgi:cupin 2 domain-containing protein